MAMALPEIGRDSNPSRGRYGYGGTWLARGTRKVWHYGETIGFSTYLARLPDKRLTIIMLTNRNDNFLGPTVDRIADVILATLVISLRGTLRGTVIAAALLATACGRDASRRNASRARR